MSINLETAKVILRDETISDDWLLLHGFKQLWYEYDGLPMCIRLPLVPLALSRDAVIHLYLEDTRAIHGYGFGWR